MAVQDNRPQLQSVINRLVTLPANILNRFAALDSNGNTTYPLLEEQLHQAISDIEDLASSRFNGTWLPAFPVEYGFANDYQYVQEPDTTQSYATLSDGTKVGLEKYDGNTTNKLTLRKKPVIDVALLQVVTPILGYTRVYTREELVLYPRQGIVEIFTYKLAVEQALLQTVDYQAWGNLLPPLPGAAQVAYCYGFPAFDPSCPAGLTDAITSEPIPQGTPVTSMSAGHSWISGDQRDGELKNWLTQLQEATICQATAMFLGTAAGLSRGLVQSMSFDGYSRSMANNPFASEIKQNLDRRDQLMKRRKRQFMMSTVG